MKTTKTNTKVKNPFDTLKSKNKCERQLDKKSVSFVRDNLSTCKENEKLHDSNTKGNIYILTTPNLSAIFV